MDQGGWSIVLMFLSPHSSNTISRELTASLLMKKTDTDNFEIKWTGPDWYECLCRLGSERNI